MKEPAAVLNLSDLETKRRLMTKISTLSGLYEVSIKPRRLTRSLNANRYYFAAVCTPFRDWLRDQWGDPTITAEQAHIEIKRAVLGVKEKLNPRTGEMMELVPPSHTMDTEEFGIFIEKAIEWLALFAGIVVIPSEMFWEKKNAA